MTRVLVTEEIAERGLGVLRDAGHEVDVRLGLAPDGLLAAVRRAHALIVRSATKVTADVLEAAAERARTFGMRLVAYDPYVPPERARQIGVDLLGLMDVVRTADFLSIHVTKTPETMGLVGDDLLKLAKPGLRIVNTARGGIVDEDALARAIRAGVVGGAGLYVFAEEPCTSSPLFELDSVVVTPHLGASTREAQDKAGATIAEQVLLALAGEFVPFAVNVAATEASETVRPFLPLTERLGRVFAALNHGVPHVLEVEYQGGLADYDT